MIARDPGGSGNRRKKNSIKPTSGSGSAKVGASGNANVSKGPHPASKPANPVKVRKVRDTGPAFKPQSGSGRAKVGASGSVKVRTKASGGVPVASVEALASAIRGAGKVGSKVLPLATQLPVQRALNYAAGKGVGVDLGGEIAKNIPLDAAELAVTTPSSLYKLADTAVHHPEQVPGMLVAPYKQLASDPVGFIGSHPVTAALMLQPAVRTPRSAAGAVLRATGKQTLKRPDATLPGSVLREVQAGSRDALRRRKQAKQDAANPNPTITAKQIAERTDRFYDAARQHTAAVQRAAARQAKERGMSREEGQQHISGAVGGAQQQVARHFAEEFGSPWRVDEATGAVLKPRNAKKGAVYATRAEADKVAEKVPFDASVTAVGDGFAVVPRVAADRLRHHRSVGSSPALGAVLMRTTRQAFGKTTLPTSIGFVTGQGVEAAGRSLVAGAGPGSFLRARRVVKAMNDNVPGSGDRMLERTIGGHMGDTGPLRDYMDNRGRTLADEFSDTPLAKPAQAMTRAGAVKPIKAVRQGYNAYTDLLFRSVNAVFERPAQTAMLGKAIKNGPLMERSLLGLSDNAIRDAARGLEGTEAQVQLARQVDDMYGKYSAYSPAMREALAHSTPFLPWYVNTARFLLKVLPVDHPVHAALLASLDKATEEWRRAEGLSLRGGDRVPDFLVGTGSGGTPIGRFLPFAPKDLPGAAGSLVLPQFMGALQNLAGVDWKGAPLNGSKTLNAVLTLGEGLIPVMSRVDQATGLGDRYVGEKKDARSVLDGRSGGEVVDELGRMVNPLAKPRKRVKKSKGSGWGEGSSGGSSSSGGGWGGGSSSGQAGWGG